MSKSCMINCRPTWPESVANALEKKYQVYFLLEIVPFIIGINN